MRTIEEFPFLFAILSFSVSPQILSYKAFYNPSTHNSLLWKLNSAHAASTFSENAVPTHSAKLCNILQNIYL